MVYVCILLVVVGGANCVFNSYVQKQYIKIVVRLLFAMLCLVCINDVLFVLFQCFEKLYRRKILRSFRLCTLKRLKVTFWGSYNEIK